MSTNPPTTAITTVHKPSALAAMGARYNVEPAKLLDTLKQTAFKNATDAQMMALVIVANEAGLNPFLKEIYAFPDKSGGIVPVISVDGWFKRINGHDQYDGMEKEFVTGADGKPHSCTVTIHRKDRKYPTKHTELYGECFRATEPWKNQPHRMLGHRATIQCARIAFGFAGADPEEAERITATPEIKKPLFGPTVEVSVASQPEQLPEPKREKRAYTRRQAEPEPAQQPETTPEPPPVYQSPPAASTPQDELAEFVTVECTATWKNFCDSVVNLQWVKGSKADMWTDWVDVSDALVSTCLLEGNREKLKAQIAIEKERADA